MSKIKKNRETTRLLALNTNLDLKKAKITNIMEKLSVKKALRDNEHTIPKNKTTNKNNESNFIRYNLIFSIIQVNKIQNLTTR